MNLQEKDVSDTCSQQIFGGEMYGYLESGFANVPKECLLKEDEEGYPWRAPQENGIPYNFSGNSLEMSKPEQHALET